MLKWICVGVVIAMMAAVICESVSYSYSPNLKIRTKYGYVKGYEMPSRSGRRIYAFRGIPYARPPLAELRFRAPQEPIIWNGTFDAVKDGNECTQKNYLIPGAPISGSEDCLYLNVFTPQIPQKQYNLNLEYPVMVYIHGGGWFSGSSSTPLLGPEYLLDEDIVLVTFNYRLGALGFLSTGDDIAPGNWALKDQLAALKWVQGNIHAFYGNAREVTVFGQSAGAASIHYHILSPNSKGLFHRAISESGSALNLWATPQDSLRIAKQQARFVRCPDNNSADMVQCLRKVDVNTLTESIENFKFWMSDPLTIFTPSVEVRSKLNPTPYLVDKPYELISSGKISNPVPWIIGIVPKEGAIRAASLIVNDDQRNELNQRFNDLGPQLLEVHKSVPVDETALLFKNMTTYYLGSNSAININTAAPFVDLYSDRGFIYGLYQTAMFHSQLSHAPIFFYHFEYRGVYSWSKYWSNTNIDFGVTHCDELIYLFSTPMLFPNLPNDHEDVTVSKKMVQLWTNFAKFGHPTPIHAHSSDPFWSSIPNLQSRNMSNSNLYYYNIARAANDTGRLLELTMKNKLYSERMQYWESLPIAENGRHF